MTIFRDIFDKSSNKGGGESGVPILPKMCVLGLRKRRFRQKKRQKITSFLLKSIDDTWYWGFDTQDFSLLWKRSRSRLSRISTVDITLRLVCHRGLATNWSICIYNGEIVLNKLLGNVGRMIFSADARGVSIPMICWKNQPSSIT